MRIANIDGRLSIELGHEIVDVERASNGFFSSDPQSVFQRWDEFMIWASRADLMNFREERAGRSTGSPVTRPGQVFAIGLNYRAHADEAGFERPAGDPPIFTKYVTSIIGPEGSVAMPEGADVDWEVELVAVIGRPARNISRKDAWSFVAGLTVGQDISDRRLQMASPAPQFSLAKSLPGFSPMGPCLVTVDEFDNPDDLELGCSINGEVVQLGSTRDLIFSIPELIEYLSARLPLEPGDVIFTGTPPGVGHAMNPPRYLTGEDTLVSWVAGLGQMSHVFIDESKQALTA